MPALSLSKGADVKMWNLHRSGKFFSNLLMGGWGDNTIGPLGAEKCFICR
jgi:hypothetical protein